MVCGEQIQYCVDEELQSLVVRARSAAMGERGTEQRQVARLVAEPLAYPRRRPPGSRHAPTLIDGRAADLDLLIEGDVQGQVGEKRRLIVVLRLNQPRAAILGDFHVPGGGVVNHIDLEMLVDGVSDRLRI